MDKELVLSWIVFGAIAIVAMIILTWAIHTLFLLAWEQAFAAVVLAITLFGMITFMGEF